MYCVVTSTWTTDPFEVCVLPPPYRKRHCPSFILLHCTGWTRVERRPGRPEDFGRDPPGPLGCPLWSKLGWFLRYCPGSGVLLVIREIFLEDRINHNQGSVTSVLLPSLSMVVDRGRLTVRTKGPYVCVLRWGVGVGRYMGTPFLPCLCVVP